MVYFVSITKTLTAAANNGGPSTWTNPNYYPAISGGSWTTQGYSGNKTVEIHANTVETRLKKGVSYVDKGAGLSKRTTRPSETIVIDFKRLRKTWMVDGWLADTPTVNAVEQYFILLAMAEEGGTVTFGYRGAAYTQAIIDEIIAVDAYETTSSTADTTYYMDTDATYSKPDEAKIKVRITLTQAFERGT